MDEPYLVVHDDFRFESGHSVTIRSLFQTGQLDGNHAPCVPPDGGCTTSATWTNGDARAILTALHPTPYSWDTQWINQPDGIPHWAVRVVFPPEDNQERQVAALAELRSVSQDASFPALTYQNLQSDDDEGLAYEIFHAGPGPDIVAMRPVDHAGIPWTISNPGQGWYLRTNGQYFVYRIADPNPGPTPSEADAGMIVGGTYLYYNDYLVAAVQTTSSAVMCF